jgi:hypothetical protein
MAVFIAAGYVFGQTSRTIERMLAGNPEPSAQQVRGVHLASWISLALVFLLGAALLVLERLSPVVFGGRAGLLSSLVMAAAAAGGFLLGFSNLRLEAAPAFSWRRGRWWMEQLAETGLGVGELVARLPLVVFRATGVLLARVVGDFFLEGVVVGGVMRLSHGLGRVLLYLHNGQVQRYLFFLLLLALVLLWSLS